MSRELPRLPNDRNRLAIVGATGTGKTVAAVWHLSKRNIDRMPWIIYDFKNDDLINSIERAKHVDVSFVPSRKDTGIFIVHPLPNETAEVENQMWKLWARENCGVYVDEGYMVGDDNAAFDAILTQGRSKRVPAIVLSQRPVWMSRFVFSESEYKQIFRLEDIRDEKTVASFIRQLPSDFSTRLSDYHSYYYDVGRHRLDLFKPVPAESEILDAIDAKLTPRRKWF